MKQQKQSRRGLREQPENPLEMLARLGFIQDPLQTLSGLLAVAAGINNLSSADREDARFQQTLALDKQKIQSQEANNAAQLDLSRQQLAQQGSYQNQNLGLTRAELDQRAKRDSMEEEWRKKQFEDAQKKEPLAQALATLSGLAQAVNASKSFTGEPNAQLNSMLAQSAGLPGLAGMFTGLLPQSTAPMGPQFSPSEMRLLELRKAQGLPPPPTNR